ncbi:LIC_10190 family membrane protein [Epilithonimonas sp. UC225_85]|uniref:LIC_10190 family membrane protein n=1 Tax=Epilithonimonas sp. UC225_85 TaxID=3350167 RepID=UPI0036D24F17
MLSILITVFILLAVNFGNGIIVRNMLKIKEQSFVLISLLGMIGITLLETLAAFLFPLNLYLEILFIVIGLVGISWLLKTEKYQFTFKFDFWFYFFLFVIIFAASFSPYLFDHYGYYVPTISYLKEVGFVKGISNLDLLLGQTSFWHIYQAGFSNFTDPFLKINSYLLILFLIYIYERKQYFLLIFLPIFLLFVQQPSPDLPILIITLIVINELINNRQSPIILYLSLFTFCIKPIVFWLPLFVILNNLSHNKFSLKSAFPVFIFGIVLMIKNLWLFGFPIFPISLPEFNLPWKPSQEMLTYSSQIGLMKSYDMKYSYQQVSGFNFFDRIFYWFTFGYKSVLNIGIIISLLIVVFFAFKQKSRFYYLLLICLLIKTILIISFSAQYRFFIDVYLVAVFLLFRHISEEKSVFTAVFLSIFISVIFTFPGFIQQFNIGKRMEEFSWSQLYKPKQVQIRINKNYKIGNFNFNASKDPVDKVHFPALNIYDLKLYDYYGVFPQYFGKDFKDGIFQRKLNPDEKNQLKNIIAETEKLKP